MTTYPKQLNLKTFSLELSSKNDSSFEQKYTFLYSLLNSYVDNFVVNRKCKKAKVQLHFDVLKAVVITSSKVVKLYLKEND